jgi:SWI/SNF-related matrix-associated actin-dependent regulator 1 of chromatin subfamily A
MNREAVLTKYRDGRPVIKIRFPFSYEDVDIVKRIPGRKWHAQYKIWTAPPTTKAIHILKEAGFVLDQGLLTFQRKRSAPTLKAIPGLLQEPYPYQMQGISFAQSRAGRCLIADDQGLGKTIQAIGWMQLNPHIGPVIIVCPAVVKLNWARELKTWAGIDATVLSGTTPYICTGHAFVINFDILHYWLPTLLALNPQAAIVDEVQFIKSGKTKRTKAVRKLSRHVKHFIGLSGTPIVNRPVEFFNAIQMIDPELFPNWITYTDRYCGRKHNGFGWVVNGATNVEELHQILTESIMIRRTKAEVLPDLPDKIRSFFPIELSVQAETNYMEAETNFLDWMRINRGREAAHRASNAQALAEIEILKQIAVAGKMPQTIDWIRNFLATGEKLVVFATHKFAINILMTEFANVAVKVDGSVSGTKRQQAVDKFQGEAATRLFVGNIKAAGVGITLTAASNVAFIELPWTPGDLVQAEDRCHRIGQEDTVNVYYLLAENTIEEKIAQLLDEKRKVLDAVLDGVETDDKNLLMELIENY